MSSTTTSPAATATQLFPTGAASTATPSGETTSHNDNGGTSGANVYYLVFLGVLLVLLLAAAALAFRAIRLRRRYRTATQMAMARGEPLPNARDPYWGLGGLSGWTQEGIDRWALDTGFGEGQGGRSNKEKKWSKIPSMYEAEVADARDGDSWDSVQPLMIHSLLPPVDPEAQQLEEDVVPIRHMGPRPRPPPMFNLRTHLRSQSPPAAAAQRATTKEIDREIADGEVLRVAVVIRMPKEEGEERGRSEMGSESEVDEEPGWQPGMELGVWEGVVGASGEERPALALQR